jgi:hypothetical protein
MHASFVTWLALAAADIIGLVGVTRFMRGRANANKPDIGSVSDRWVAEHRASQSNASTR